jgi:hypothetical protein
LPFIALLLYAGAMNTISAFSYVANEEKLSRELVEAAGAESDGFPTGAAADLLLTVATELGIGKVAIKIWKFVYALFGWLINFFRKMFNDGSELPEELSAIVKDAKGIAVVDGKPRNREKYALHRRLLSISAELDGGEENVWVIMRAIRELPKDKLVKISAETFGELVEQLGSGLGCQLTVKSEAAAAQPVKKSDLNAINRALRKHAKDVAAHV